MNHYYIPRWVAGALILLALLGVFTCSTCGGEKSAPVISGEKTVQPPVTKEETPTVTVVQSGSLAPNTRALSLPVLTPGVHDTLKVYLPGRIDTVLVPADTAAIVADFLKRRTYETTLPVDTAGVKGSVTARGQVQFNRLDSLQLYYQLTLPAAAKDKPKKWGLGLQAGATLINRQVQPYGGIGLSWNPIRF